MKASRFFGGTNPKETGRGVRQVGNTGSVKGGGISKENRATVKQANVNAVVVPQRKLPNNPLSFERRPISKPSVKEDNRGKGRYNV